MFPDPLENMEETHENHSHSPPRRKSSPTPSQLLSPSPPTNHNMLTAMKVPMLVMLIAVTTGIAIISGFVAFYPLYSEATSSSGESADQYANEVAVKVSTSVQNLLSSAVTYTLSMGRSFRLGSALKSNNDSIVRWFCDFEQEAPLVYFAYFDDGTGISVGRTSSLNSSMPPRDNHSLVAYVNSNSHAIEFQYVPDDNISFQPTAAFHQFTTFNVSVRPFAAPMHRNYGWVAPFVDYSKQFADFGIGGPLRDPMTQQTYGIYGVFFFYGITVITYLKTLKVAKTGQAFLIEASTKSYIGGTTYDRTVKSAIVDGVITTVLASPDDVQTPICRRALDALGQQLYTCLSCSLRVGSGSDILFVSVIALQDKYGLDLRVVVAVPSDDFLSGIHSGMRTGLVAAACSIAGLMVLVAMGLRLMLVPLKRLEERLYASSSLAVEEDSDAESESIIAEIANIQTASTKLQSELKKVKSYLPQSVLRRLELEQEDEGDVDEGEVGLEASLGSKGTLSNSAAVSHYSSNGRKKAISDELAITSRRVTVLAINLGGLLKMVSSVTPALVQLSLAKAMDAILLQVNAAKGVVESVSGDHFVVSFNGSTPCSTHATRAASLIMSLSNTAATQQQQQDNELMSRIQIGCATAHALCGNFGSDKLRRFSILGSVVNHAHHLMTRCRHYGVHGLVAAGSADLMSLEYDLQHVGLEALPHAPVGSRLTAAAIVSAVLRKKEATDDEWMYQLDQQRLQRKKSTSTPVRCESVNSNEWNVNSVHSMERLVNQVFELLAEGDRSEAQKLANVLPVAHPLKVHCSEALQNWCTGK